MCQDSTSSGSESAAAEVAATTAGAAGREQRTRCSGAATESVRGGSVGAVIYGDVRDEHQVATH
ncbi:hypothetical protein [Rhodococcus sp. T2V]|uniref:hypothetical protein n=1 Tax=Rhodococcus sp. T2V TaxID=3034164 RepID=UPI0023E2CBD2|nr:hypothetical protein [Rhodococcus sp. T2V]